MSAFATDERYLRVSEAARELNVSRQTVHRAVRRGELLAFRIGPRGQLRIPQSSLSALLQPVRRLEEEKS